MRKIIIVCGKSGTGKDFFVKNILKKHNEIKRLKEYTTRKIRNESDLENYNFSNVKEMNSYLNRGKVLECRSFEKADEGAVFYFNLAEDKNINEINIMTSSPFALPKITKYYGRENILLVSITCDIDIIYKRLIKRNHSKDEIIRRMECDDIQFKSFDYFDIELNSKNDINDMINQFDIVYNEFIMKGDDTNIC